MKEYNNQHNGPASYQDMVAFAEMLRNDYGRAKEFFQAAGIIDEDGNLTE